MLKTVHFHRQGFFEWLMVLCAVVILSGCSYFQNSKDEVYVAKVDDKTYPLKDLRSQLPAGMTKPDSLARVNDILTRWVKKELLLKMAIENLDESQKDLSKELEEYGNALLIHRYQQQLLSQKLDTALTDQDIRRYYEINPEKFTLDYNIVKAVYVEIPKNVAKTDQIRRWMTENSTRSMSELESYSFQYASKYDHFNNGWVDFNNILARIPGGKEDPEQMLRRSKFLQFSDLNNFYFVLINDYILAGEKAPYDFVKDRIESLILNSRKMEFLQDLEKNIYEKGKRENRFAIKEFK
ncbi:MAG: hypothetical protein M0R39_15920 [Prolixibacteraceae bacterium]|jgi:hypothetical protein|nr:hypothetical protein [Prolixibacteraceae bacterium]